MGLDDIRYARIESGTAEATHLEKLKLAALFGTTRSALSHRAVPPYMLGTALAGCARTVDGFAGFAHVGGFDEMGWPKTVFPITPLAISILFGRLIDPGARHRLAAFPTCDGRIVVINPSATGEIGIYPLETDAYKDLAYDTMRYSAELRSLQRDDMPFVRATLEKAVELKSQKAGEAPIARLAELAEESLAALEEGFENRPGLELCFRDEILGFDPLRDDTAMMLNGALDHGRTGAHFVFRKRSGGIGTYRTTDVSWIALPVLNENGAPDSIEELIIKTMHA